MPNHDDELNRLLDALATGVSDPPDELDSETGDTARRFMMSAQAYRASAEFSDRLGAMLNHISPVPALAGRPIEHVGEGVGLVAAMPAPRSFHFGRAAAIAAVALLMIAVGGFYRSGSDNGGNLIFAPVASASPAQEFACSGDATAQATFEANRTARVYSPIVSGGGAVRQLSEFPGKFFTFWPESMLPTGPNADEATLAELDPVVRRDVYCSGKLPGAYGQPSGVEVVSSVVLEDGRVGLRIKTDISGFPIDEFLVYAKGPDLWFLLEWAATMPDDQLAASATIHAKNDWVLQFYDVTGAMGPNNETMSYVQYTTDELRVHANQPASIDVQNIGKITGRFQIPDAGVDQTIESGANATISATLTEGWHHFTTTIDGVPGGGFIYAEPLAESAIVPASDCNQVDIGFAAMDNLVSRNNTNFDSIVVRHAPNDPNGNYGVIAYEDLPLGNAPDSALSEAIRLAVLNDAACSAARINSVVPTVSEYHAILQAEAQGTPRAALATATVAPAEPGGANAAVPEILEIRKLDNQTVGALTAERDGNLGLQTFQYYSLTGDTWVRMNSIFVAPAGWIASTIAGEPAGSLTGTVWDDQFHTYEPAPGYIPFEAKVVGNQPISIELNNPTDATVSLEIQGSDESITLRPGKSVTRSITLPPGTYRLAMYADDVLVGRGFLYVTSPPPASATPVS